ncbi:MAG: fatty acid desaturase family protein [Salibacteraceae bacterium]
MIIKNSNKNHFKSWLDISGVVNEENIEPKVTWDLKTPASLISKAVGVNQMRELHEANKWIDILLILSAWVFFLATWYIIATIDFGFSTLLLMILQGAILGNYFYAIRHDTLMHRQFGGSKFSYILGISMSIPMLNTYTRFLKHEDHHFHVGYDLFEEHIAEMDTVWKRWLGITGIGLILLYLGKLKPKGSSKPNGNWKDPEIIHEASKLEGLLLLFWFIGIIVLAFFFPYSVIMGYIIPTIIVMPALLSVKNATQHSETDVNNNMHLSAYFKANLFIRVLYCCSLGDVHLVHHIFPKIPFWKTPKAARIFEETIEAHGVPKRTFTEVLIGYYFQGMPYRKRWTK